MPIRLRDDATIGRAGAPPRRLETEISRPTVLLDATAIPADLGGVGRYLEQLIPLLAERVDLVVASQPRDAELWRRIAPAARVEPAAETVRRARRMLWEQRGLPRLARRVGADVIHSPHYTMPLSAGVPVVVTLHDATFFTDARLHTPLKRVFFRAWTRLALRRAALCIVPSRATRDELVRVVDARAGRCMVIHHGVDDSVFRRPTAAERREAASLAGSDTWITFLGTLEPRKNVTNLVRAFARVRQGRPGLRLVLAGSRGWDGAIDAALAESADGVTELGYVAKDALPGLLGGAEVVAYPSLGEGFGLPVLEAMACGAAVLTTARLALPEVGGDAVAYCEPDADSIARELAALLDDPDRRRYLGRRGRARAREFSWAGAAQLHAEAYRSAAAAR